MGYDPERAIDILRKGLAPERPHTFVQADALASGVVCEHRF